jgi:hypothetical protein
MGCIKIEAGVGAASIILTGTGAALKNMLPHTTVSKMRKTILLLGG